MEMDTEKIDKEEKVDEITTTHGGMAVITPITKPSKNKKYNDDMYRKNGYVRVNEEKIKSIKESISTINKLLLLNNKFGK